MPKPCETAARKMPKRCFWNLLKTKKKGCLKQGKPLRNVRLGSLQAKLKKKVFGTRMRKGRTPAGFVPKPLRNRSRKNAETSLLEPIKKKERNRAQTMRNRSQKTAETLLLEPTKNAEKRKMPMRNRSQKTAETLLLEPTKNKEKTCKPPGQTQEKGVWDAHAKKQNPSRFCAEAMAKPQPEKCRNVAFGTH